MDSVGVNDNFIESLKSHFAFGIRIASPIEMMRFKRFYADDYGMDCSWTDEEIMDKIQRNCFIQEEKLNCQKSYAKGDSNEMYTYTYDEEIGGIILNPCFDRYRSSGRICKRNRKNKSWSRKYERRGGYYCNSADTNCEKHE